MERGGEEIRSEIISYIPTERIFWYHALNLAIEITHYIEAISAIQWSTRILDLNTDD